MSEILAAVYCVSISMPLILLIYFFLPKLEIILSKDKYSYKNIKTGTDFIEKVFLRLHIPEIIKRNILAKLEESGIGNSYTWIYWLILTIFIPLLLLVYMTASHYGILSTLSVSALCYIIPNAYLKVRITARKNAFTINAYKLYYFLHSQISSGIKVTDAIRELHNIADNQLINGVFVRFVAHYELTLNIDEALSIIRKSFRGYDSEMLCASIKQCVDTGLAGKTLLKMEHLMFSKYFSLLQKETASYKTRLLIGGLLAIAPLIMLFVLPVIYDALEGFSQILKTSIQ